MGNSNQLSGSKKPLYNTQSGSVVPEAEGNNEKSGTSSDVNTSSLNSSESSIRDKEIDQGRCVTEPLQNPPKTEVFAQQTHQDSLALVHNYNWQNMVKN